MNQLPSQETLTGIEVRTIDAVCINVTNALHLSDSHT